MTKREIYTEVIEIVSASETANKAEIIDRITKDIEALDKKSTSKTATKTQKQNIENVEIVYNALAEIGKPVTVTELITATNIKTVENEAMTTSKVTALLKKLLEAGRVVRTTEKKKALYSVATAE